MIYSSQHAEIMVDGRCSQSIKLEQGIRQGCPLSPLLFNLSIEILAIAIRLCNEIQGIQILGTSHKIALYADDVVIFLPKSYPIIHCVRMYFDEICKNLRL